jgi:hypothetical protein
LSPSQLQRYKTDERNNKSKDKKLARDGKKKANILGFIKSENEKGIDSNGDREHSSDTEGSFGLGSNSSASSVRSVSSMGGGGRSLRAHNGDSNSASSYDANKKPLEDSFVSSMNESKNKFYITSYINASDNQVFQK